MATAHGHGAILSPGDLDDLHRFYARYDTPETPPARQRPYNREQRERTLEEVARYLDMSLQDVARTEARALKKLRLIIRENGLEAGFRELLR